MAWPKHMKVVESWFDGLNRSDLESLVELFDTNPVIVNAANPPLVGPEAPRKLLVDFFGRTESREFRVLGAAEGDGMTFAWWRGTLTFRAGIQIGQITIARPFSITIEGIERFVFDDLSGKVRELDIIHETASVVRAARENAIA